MNLVNRILFFGFTMTIAIPYSLRAAEFNPNYIISDAEMQDSHAMDRSDIQAFLDDKGGFISSLQTFDWQGIDRMSSDIIYRAAQDNNINPKYILVKLQKEQSLITDTKPSQKQLDWATGYGVCDTCNMSDPDIQKYKGFGTQIDRSAGIIRWYYDNMNTQSWIKKANIAYTIDDTTVTPQNNATAFLYTYTPHLHGNENFWKLWQDWFEQIYPDTTLVQVSGEPEIYLIQNGQRRKFTNMTSLVTRFDPKMILTIPKTELTRYPEGPAISLPNYAIVKNESEYYLIDYDYKRKFESYETVKQLGYNPDEIIDVTSEDLDAYVAGSVITASNVYPLGRLVRVAENNQLYYIQDGAYHSLYDETIAQINFPNLSIEKIVASEISGLQKGSTTLLKNGTLFGIIGDSKIYVVEKQKKRHIATAEVFVGLGYTWENIIWINQYAGDAHETGQALYLDTPISMVANEKNSISSNSNLETQEPSPSTQLDPVEYMVRTPEDKISFIGKQITTPIDSYAISNVETGEILAGKNVDTVRPMASLTKIATGYQLLLDGIMMEKTTVYNKSLHDSLYDNFRIIEGEAVKNTYLMDVMLVSSFNAPALMLVNPKGEGIQAFVTRMNQTVAGLGLTQTKFVDVDGISEYNVSTAREYTKLFAKLARNNTLQQYLGKKSYSFTESIDHDGMPDHFDTHNNPLANEANIPYTIIASKTGFTYDAGGCLAMLIERKTDHTRFVVLTMGNPDFGKKTRFNEPRIIADWAMNNL
ncbi:MAG: D-alanyl-D-alanine carboxypeptidase [Candidatus Magasanikbacteria bacterium]|nr:D-alanyl-D-alanine carboxypeptidase [Candidatus Magasanikbacteria bacterium]